jgi:Tol biopolymer transport system component
VPARYSTPRFSPDGSRLAVQIEDGKQSDVWVYEWERDILARLTFDTGNNVAPLWTPDGRRIAFGSDQATKGTPNIYWKRADGSGDVQRLTESKNPQFPRSWHPTGRFLAFMEISPQTGLDIMILPMEGDEISGWKPGKSTAFLNGLFREEYPAFSPDGRWLAYTFTESGSENVYVRPFPGPGGRWQISSGGGTFPTWSRNGKELFFRTEDQKIMVAAYTVVGDSFRADRPQLWSEGQFTDRGPRRNFDLHPDGKRFAVLKAAETQAEARRDKVVFIFNFFDELRRLAPTGRK